MEPRQKAAPLIDELWWTPFVVAVLFPSLSLSRFFLFSDAAVRFGGEEEEEKEKFEGNPRCHGNASNCDEKDRLFFCRFAGRREGNCGSRFGQPLSGSDSGERI